MASSSVTSPPTDPMNSVGTRASSCELVAAGRARPHVCATFVLGDAAAALRYVADGRAIGKVVLDVAGSSEQDTDGC